MNVAVIGSGGREHAICFQLQRSKEIKKLLEDKSFLEKILKQGTEKAIAIAESNLKEIKNIVGFF